jgi:hypothetical protein
MGVAPSGKALPENSAASSSSSCAPSAEAKLIGQSRFTNSKRGDCTGAGGQAT